jgi:hypothetical protein
MRSLAKEFRIGSLAGMMDEESSGGIQYRKSDRMRSLAEELSIGSLAGMMDEESSRGIQYRKSDRDDG